MTIYKGLVPCREVMVKLHDAFITEGYTEISTDVTTDGRVYKSTGSDGQNALYFKLQDLGANDLTLGIYEKYEPNVSNGLPGVFTNGYEGTVIKWNTTTSTDREKVNYVFNVTKDRAIIFVEGQNAEPSNHKTLVYIGMPKRYDPEDTGNNFAGMAYTSYGPSTYNTIWRALKNKALINQSSYSMDFYMPAKSYGWGNKLFFSPMFLGSDTEGARGEFDGLFVVEKTDDHSEILHGDTFNRNGKEYMLVTLPAGGSYTLNTGYDYIIEV